VTRTDFPDTDRLASAVACFDLPDTTLAAAEIAGDRFEDPVAARAEWDALLGHLVANRLEGPLAWSLALGAWSVAPELEQEAAAAHQRAMSLALLLERDLLQVAARLGDDGVPFRVLKGSALAHLDEPDPSRRAFGDIDLLVRGIDIERVEALLTERGGVRRYAEPRRGFDRRFSKGASFSFGHNSEVDLHRTLTAGPFGLTIDLDELFDHTETFRIAGVELHTVDRRSRFLHACFHAMLGSPSPRTSTLRDIVRTAPVDVEELRATLARAERWQAEAVVALAVMTTRRRFGWRPLPELLAWAEHTYPSSRDRRWLAGSSGGERTYARQMVTGIEAVPRPADKLAYALAITLPTSAPGRHALTDRWRRGLRALRQTLR
jgi:hypothetical protein